LALYTDARSGPSFRDQATTAFAIAGLARLAIGGEINDNFLKQFL
jgi:hypothetical protein